MKHIKNLFIIGLIVSTVSAFGASSTTTISGNAQSNLLSGFGTSGAALLTSVVVTAPANNSVTVSFIDTPDGTRKWTNDTYQVVSSYATNLVYSYTNFFGAVDSFTNLVLVDVTNTVAATTNNWPTILTVTAATNTSSTIVGANYYFQHGVYATNSSAGAATVSITYLK